LAEDVRIIWANIFETLVYLDENMEVQPRLAIDWEATDDARA
jgi:ABC-type transport system substrate-binding protein